MALNGAQGCILKVAQCGLHDGFAHEETVTHEPVHKGIRVVVVGILPRRAMQPEGVAGRFGQPGIPSLHDPSGRQVGHKGAKLEDDAKEFRVFPRAGCRCRDRLRSAHRHRRLAFVARDDHLPTARGNRDKGAGALRMSTPDSFHPRRVGRSLLKAKDHASASQV